ncbi:MAG: hypothetical protein RIT81_42995 [Deltaproteobacteria bacterium]
MGSKVTRGTGTSPLHVDATPGSKEVQGSEANPAPTAPDPRPSDPATRPSTQRAMTSSTAFGRFAKPVAAVMMAATLGMGCAAHGQTLEDTGVRQPTEVVRPADFDITSPDHLEPRDTNTRDFTWALNRLQERRDRGQITMAQYVRAESLLRSALLGGSTVTLARDHKGRVDIDALVAVGDLGPNAANLTRGQLRMRQLAETLEFRMRITAREMATGNYTQLDGAPGYKELSQDEMQDLLTDALQDIPLNELAGGRHLAALVKNLPLTDDIDAENMSIRELGSRLGDEYGDWLEDKAKPLIEGRELEVGLVAFGAVTALRASSPDAAKLIDGLSPRSTIYSYHSDDRSTNLRARLAYRDQHVFPDLDLEARTRYIQGDTTYRASVGGTLSFENDDILTGTASVGARHDFSSFSYLDASGTYMTQNDRWRANITYGRYDPVDGWNLSTGLTGVFGEDVAIGDANGRIRWETDITRDVEIGRARGDFGFYLGVGADSDFENDEVMAGAVFRLKF